MPKRRPAGRVKRGRPDKLPTKFKLGSIYKWGDHIELPRIVERYVPEADYSKISGLIFQAFARATWRLIWQSNEFGPTVRERRELALQIAELSHKLSFALTSEDSGALKPDLIQWTLFDTVGHGQAVQDIVPLLAELQIAASKIVLLEPAALGGKGFLLARS
jgi:hypothetical protein